MQARRRATATKPMSLHEGPCSSIIYTPQRSLNLLAATITPQISSSTTAQWTKPTPAVVLAGILVAQFQLVGRSNADRLFALAGSSPLLELRLWVLLILSCWLFVVSTLRRPVVSRDQTRVLNTWRNSTLLFLAYMVLTTVWAPDLQLALAKAYDLLILAWCCVLAVTVIRLFGIRAMIDGFWLGVFLSGSILAAYGVLSALSTQGSSFRLAVLGGGPNVFGRNMGLLAILSLHLAFSNLRWVRRAALVSAPLSGLLVLQSGSRGAMLALFVGVIVLLWGRRFDRRVLYSGVFVAIIAAVTLATRFGELAALIFRERFIVLLLAQRYFTHRDTLLLDGLTAGLENPVGGLGLAGFVQLDSPGLYPHNFLVEAFSEGGLIGLAFLLIPFFYYILRWRSGMTAGHPLTVAGLSLLFVSSSISGDLFDARGVFLLLLMALASQVRHTPRAA